MRNVEERMRNVMNASFRYLLYLNEARDVYDGLRIIEILSELDFK